MKTARISTICAIDAAIVLWLTFHLRIISGLTTLPVTTALRRPNPIVRFITVEDMMDSNDQQESDREVNNQASMLQMQPTQKPDRRYKFVTNRQCPYAQKVWMALEAWQIPYTLVEIPLYGHGGKPDWFLKLNPQGTVPVLVISDHSLERIITGSNEILDMLLQESRFGDTTNNNNNDNCDSYVWDRHELIDQQLLVAGKSAVLRRGDPKNMLALHQVLHQMEEQLQQQQYHNNNNDRDAGFLTTKQKVPSILDCHTFPFLWRLQSEFQILDTFPNLLAWYRQLATDRAVVATMPLQWWWWW